MEKLLRMRIRDLSAGHTVAEHYDVDSVRVVRRIAAEWALKHLEYQDWVIQVYKHEEWRDLGDDQSQLMQEIIAGMVAS